MSPDDPLPDLARVELPVLPSWEEADAWSRGDDLLDHLRVASPCNASWAEMEGDDLVRFCQHCRKNVYNLSGMSRRDAADFVRTTAGQLCVRFYRRRDGTLLTDNCPVGFRAARRMLLKCMGSVAATVLGLFGVLSPILLAPSITGEIASHRRGNYEIEDPPPSPVAPSSLAQQASHGIDAARQVTPRRPPRRRRSRGGRRR
jgi:hypothetical protein